jgi:glucokinase
MCAYSIGVDLGGTNLRAAAIDENGRQLERHSIVTPNREARPEEIVASVVALVRGVQERVGRDDLLGVGIGVPGYIKMDTGVIIGAANLPLTGFPIRDDLQRRLGIPILLENDANAAALGEYWMGAGRGVKNLFLLTLGTGIGGGIIVDGKVLHGFAGMAGEPGHMTVYPDGNPCGCGNQGCLEKHASATAVVGMARMLGLGENGITSADVYQMAAAGNSKAKVVFECMGRALGIALATLINLFNFPLYLLSGGPLPAWDAFAPSMFAEVNRRSYTYSRTDTKIEKAALGSEAGLYGAAYLPFQRREEALQEFRDCH